MKRPNVNVVAYFKTIIITGASLAVMSGCTSIIVKSDSPKIDKAQVMELKPGVTDKKSVLAAFGEPTEANSADNEEKLVYTYKEKTTPVYLKGLIENEAGGTKTSTTLEIILKDGVVNSYNYKTVQE